MQFNPYAEGGPYTVKPDQCFAVMPYGQTWSDAVWREIKACCASQGLRAVRGDESLGSNILTDIWRELNQSRAIIVDVTANNANVMYELGLAHALKKDVILIAQNADDIPFDLRVYRHVLYEPGGAGSRALAPQLGRSLSELFLRDNFGRIIGPDDFLLLFLSTGGTCRCAMSNTITRYLLAADKSQQGVEDGPAGLKSMSVALVHGSLPQMSPGAQDVVRERLGVDGGRHKTVQATAALLDRADLILPMAAGLTKGLAAYEGKWSLFTTYFGQEGDIVDPWGQSKAEYVSCFERIYAVLAANIDGLASLAREKRQASVMGR